MSFFISPDGMNSSNTLRCIGTRFGSHVPYHPITGSINGIPIHFATHIRNSWKPHGIISKNVDFVSTGKMGTFVDRAIFKNPVRSVYGLPVINSGTPPGTKITEWDCNARSMSSYVAGMQPRCRANHPTNGTANSHLDTANTVVDPGLKCADIRMPVHKIPCGWLHIKRGVGKGGNSSIAPNQSLYGILFTMSRMYPFGIISSFNRYITDIEIANNGGVTTMKNGIQQMNPTMRMGNR